MLGTTGRNSDGSAVSLHRAGPRKQPQEEATGRPPSETFLVV